ncbi:MAG: hypothetical protein ABW061_20670 [Polyangiaceae bacterium]
MADGDIENRARLEMWVSGIVLVVAWMARVLLSPRSTFSLVLVGVAYVSAFALVRALRLRAAAGRKAR